MSPEVKQSISREEKIKAIKDFIASASLGEVRLLDIALKDRKHEVINSGVEESQPAINLFACESRGREYIYSQEHKEGKKVTRKIKEAEILDYNFETAKITPKAKEVLKKKYGIEF